MVEAVVVDSMHLRSFAGLEVWFRKRRFSGWFVLESSPTGSQCHAGGKSISIHLV